MGCSPAAGAVREQLRARLRSGLATNSGAIGPWSTLGAKRPPGYARPRLCRSSCSCSAEDCFAQQGKANPPPPPAGGESSYARPVAAPRRGLEQALAPSGAARAPLLGCRWPERSCAGSPVRLLLLQAVLYKPALVVRKANTPCSASLSNGLQTVWPDRAYTNRSAAHAQLRARRLLSFAEHALPLAALGTPRRGVTLRRASKPVAT